MKKVFRSIAVFMAFTFFLTACGNTETKNETTIEIEEISEVDEVETTIKETAEGYDILGGQLWEVGGIYYKNKIIDINDNAALKDLYDSYFLSFSSDGTFTYLYVFPEKGTYKVYDGDGKYKYFLLKTEKSYKYDSNKGEFVENELASPKTYIIAVLDNNTIEFVEFDSITGKAKANEDPVIYVRPENISSFIQNNKIDIPQSTGNESESSNEVNDNTGGSQQSINGNASYQSILDEYTRKMEEAVPRLIDEYYSKSSGISDIERLAEICNDKVGKLAEICNEGVSEMAELMYSQGDSYNTYESWAGKLMDNYTVIAEEIMDAYLDSVMY